MRKQFRKICLFGMALATFGSASCGTDDFAFGDVEGVVEWNSQPLPNILVQFHPEPSRETKAAPSSEGVTDETGHYRLRCPQQKRDGVVVGLHRVVLIDVKGTRLPVEYASTSQTKLRVTVQKGSQVIDLKLPK
jgi:hypothetical protein